MTVTQTQAHSLPLGSPVQNEQLTRAAQRWVSQTFYGTLLKQMHESPFKSELFSGGRGGEAFSMLLDQHLTDRIAQSSDQGLVRSIVRSIERKQQGHGPHPLAPLANSRPRVNFNQKASSYVAPTR